MRVRPLWLALLVGLAAPAAAATPSDDMAEAAARIDAAGAALATATDPEARLSALSVAIGAYQSALDVLRAGVNGASARERELSLALEARRDQIQHLIAALESMSRTPPPAQALHPAGPIGAARAAAMMTSVTTALRSESESLAAEYDEVAAIRALRLRGERDLATGIAALGTARTELGETLALRAPPPPRGTEDPAMALLLRDSDTLTVLAAKLAGTRAGDPDAPPPTLIRPVSGDIARGYQMPDGAGVRRPGIVMRAPPLSLVSAPADAIVRYAGPFLDYGYVVVLEADDDTLIVLAGLAQLQVATGAAVRAGGLIGLLGGPAFEEGAPAASAGGAVESTASGADETLYIEVRHGGGPVDPAPLFADDNG
ncbi:peptidoglycan DD-metalloendopeptidase family protein [Amaricoccus sp.]|uniref:murein hydrolase activator EnvC family protein n=1 Tax=Amaricoccus sp. TaxID=1872485 RepID=UPI0026083767|nr:peptidoglycan DD-metalloendopeptidase family protein [uncultured Amaricoccus sp.]